MMHRLLAFIAALAVVSPAASSAADKLKPLRTLVYAVVYTAQNRNDEKVSGFNSAGNGAGTPGNVITRVSDTGDDGTLTVSVVAATGDGGLVVDAAFAGKSTQQPVSRVAIFSDGRLSIPPDATLSPAAIYLLPLLARGLVANQPIQQGATWSRPAAEPAKGTTTFHVLLVDGEKATLKIDASVSVRGARGYDETDAGTAVYDTAKLAPVSYDLVATSRHTVAEQYITSSARLTAKLVSDSFGAK